VDEPNPAQSSEPNCGWASTLHVCTVKDTRRMVRDLYFGSTLRLGPQVRLSIRTDTSHDSGPWLLGELSASRRTQQHASTSERVRSRRASQVQWFGASCKWAWSSFASCNASQPSGPFRMFSKRKCGPYRRRDILLVCDGPRCKLTHGYQSSRFLYALFTCQG